MVNRNSRRRPEDQFSTNTESEKDTDENKENGGFSRDIRDLEGGEGDTVISTLDAG